MNFSKPFKPVVSFLFRGYRWVLSPMIHWIVGPGYGCRHEVSCSEYFENAVRQEGWAMGSIKGIRRICTCQPWGGFAGDPQ